MKDGQTFNDFLKADHGVFNGFDLDTDGEFSRYIEGRDWEYVDIVDDTGYCGDIYVGNDGATCYFYVLPEKVTKVVRFNDEAYLF